MPGSLEVRESRTAPLVLLLARQRVVHTELVGVLLHDGLDLIIVQLRVAVGRAHEQPRQPREPVKEKAALEAGVTEGRC